MRTTQERFHPMSGHVIDGMEIKMENGDLVVLKNSMKGWRLTLDGVNLGTPCKSAVDVTARVVDYPFDFSS